MVHFHAGNDDSAVDFGGSYFQTDPSHDAIEYGSGSNSYPPNYVMALYTTVVYSVGFWDCHQDTNLIHA